MRELRYVLQFLGLSIYALIHKLTNDRRKVNARRIGKTFAFRLY